MNQDQVKEKLIELADPIEYFTVIFSGKTSNKVDGLYKPDNHEIIIHNKNMDTDNQIMYTAIHEYAHHLQFVRSPTPISTRAHTTYFWNIFHELLIKGEEVGSYQNIFESDPEFGQLTAKIKGEFLAANGELMKQFGNLLLQAYHLCRRKHADFEDYVDRELGLPRATAKTLIKVSSLDIDPRIGYDNMKTVASIRDDGQRKLAEDAFVQGESPDRVKSLFLSHHSQKEAKAQKTQLIQERTRLEKQIQRLKERLKEVEEMIVGLGDEKLIL